MTVGIGVLSDVRFAQGPCIIMAVDDRACYGNPPLLSTNACGKFHDLLPFAPLAVAISGDISTCDGVVADLCTWIADIRKKREDANELPVLRHDDFRNAVRLARHYEYQAFLDDSLQAYLGMSREEWLRETDREKKRKGLVVVRACIKYFPVGLIVGGFLGTNWIHLKAWGADRVETGAQCFAVGIGAVTALQKLSQRGQHEYISAPRSLLHIAEAMESARLAYPRYIGAPADYMVLRPNKPMMRFKRSASCLQTWLNQFGGQPTDQLQTGARYREEFEAALYEYRSLNL